MPLHEDPRFNRSATPVPADVIGSALTMYRDALSSAPWLYCGYDALPELADTDRPAFDVSLAVDNDFRLGPACGFERTPAVVTAGLRSSRFASLLFWEVLHAIEPGGIWIDIDEAERCTGTALSNEDFPVREYFRDCLQPEAQRRHGRWLLQTFRKTAASPVAARIGDVGWSFGILTSGNSPRAAEMAASILALDLPAIEVIFCGPRPERAPVDERVRAIDLEHPQPRGWITRKKNAFVAAARHENLCVLHDRFVITPAWAEALRAYGPCFSFLTFPQIFYADLDRRFPQRYADYQVLDQRRGLVDALESHVYHGGRVFYPPYDAFYETAFCCGGLYVAKRSLWQRVSQNEALFHSEWEDVSFGLECQRRGMPHRVNRHLTVESLTPHPMALTRIHQLTPPDTRALGYLHIAPAQEQAARTAPARFKPIIDKTREEYYQHVLARFNANPHLAADDRLAFEDVAPCVGIADFWRVIERRIARLSLGTRAELAAIAFFLSDAVYNWPNCELLATVRANEAAREAWHRLLAFDTVVGWGTGSRFTSMRPDLDRELACLVDGDPGRWQTVVGGMRVDPPSALSGFDPATTAVVVFSCYLEDITEAVHRLGPFRVFAADAVTAARRVAPLPDLIRYFDEIERYYPVLFRGTESGMAA